MNVFDELLTPAQPLIRVTSFDVCHLVFEGLFQLKWQYSDSVDIQYYAILESMMIPPLLVTHDYLSLPKKFIIKSGLLILVK